MWSSPATLYVYGGSRRQRTEINVRLPNMAQSNHHTQHADGPGEVPAAEQIPLRTGIVSTRRISNQWESSPVLGSVVQCRAIW